jgi:hypothetical protein
MSLTFYRSVSLEELEELLITRQFHISSNSLEGKFFAETFEAARCWGEILNGTDAFSIVKVEVARGISPYLDVFPNLDGIGTAYFVTYDLLGSFNRLILSVMEVNDAS